MCNRVAVAQAHITQKVQVIKPHTITPGLHARTDWSGEVQAWPCVLMLTLKIRLVLTAMLAFIR
jgi:hypothetical protein